MKEIKSLSRLPSIFLKSKFFSWVKNFNLNFGRYLRSKSSNPQPSMRDESYYLKLGWRVLIGGLGVFFLWGSLAPIDKGVSVSAWVITDTNRKAIQAVGGGVISEILIREGQRVVEGQILVKLNPTNAESQTNATQHLILGFEEQIKALSNVIEQKNKELQLLQQQIIGLKELAKDGYIAYAKVRDVERQKLQLQSSISENQGSKQRLQAQALEMKERLGAFQYDLSNTLLKSPVNGEVVNLQVFTQGGVVTSAQKLMEIIPSEDSLVVEGQLPVHLVDKVRIDLPVEMLFTAYNVNRTPHIPGRVVSVGADRIIDEKTSAPYYKVQVRATATGAEQLREMKVRPGMPVEIFIKTGEQTLMTYLLKPIIDRTHSAMREE